MTRLVFLVEGYILDRDKMNQDIFKIDEIKAGYHPDGFTIDRDVVEIKKYTKWRITSNGSWTAPTPIKFDELPKSGWFKKT